MNKVFVYGTLKQGFGNNRRLHEGRTEPRFLGYAMTTDVFAMTSTGFPFVIDPEHAQGLPHKNVLGELYEVDDRVMASCDQLEGYRGPGKDNFYDRRTVEVVDADGEVHKTNIYIVNSKGYSRASEYPICRTTTFLDTETYVF